MTTLYAIDGTGRWLHEAGEYDGPDTLSIREQPDPLFGPRRAKKKAFALDRRHWPRMRREGR